MIYVFDTDVLTLARFGDSAASSVIRRRVLEIAEDDKVVTTIITYEEQMRGWLGYLARSSDLTHQVTAYRKLKEHVLTFNKLEVLPFDLPAAIHFERLRKSKSKVGTNDLKIAAIALAQSATVITCNTRDFARIPNLKHEDWTRE